MSAAFILVKDYPTNYDYSGSAFFISYDGYCLTAAHIFENDLDIPLLAALNPADLTSLVPVLRKVISLREDVALCKVDLRLGSYYSLAAELPKRGSKVSAIGYGGRKGTVAQLNKIECEYLGATTIDMTARPPISAKYFPAVLTYPGLPVGFSGGPLLDQAGNVIGLHSHTLKDENINRKYEKNDPIQVSVSVELLRNVLRQIPGRK